MSYPFAVLRVQPDRMRGESMNIGLVVFLPDRVMARIETDLTRLRALDPNLPNLPILNDLATEIEARVSPLPTRDMQLMMLRDFFAPIHADTHLGSIEAQDEDSLMANLDRLMIRLVGRAPITSPVQFAPGGRP